MLSTIFTSVKRIPLAKTSSVPRKLFTVQPAFKRFTSQVAIPAEKPLDFLAAIKAVNSVAHPPATEETFIYDPDVEQTYDEPFASAREKVMEELDYEFGVLRENFNFSEVPIRYAWLLYSLYRRKNATSQTPIEGLFEDLSKLVTKMAQDETMNGMIYADDHESMLQESRMEKFLKENSDLPKPIADFLSVLAENGRTKDLADIVREVPIIVDKVHFGVSKATVTSASELTKAQKDDIIASLRTSFELDPEEEIEVVNKVDPALQGGYTLDFDDNYTIDNSVVSKTREMNKAYDEIIEQAINGISTNIKGEYKVALEEAKATAPAEFTGEGHEVVAGEYEYEYYTEEEPKAVTGGEYEYYTEEEAKAVTGKA